MRPAWREQSLDLGRNVVSRLELQKFRVESQSLPRKILLEVGYWRERPDDFRWAHDRPTTSLPGNEATAFEHAEGLSYGDATHPEASR